MLARGIDVPEVDLVISYDVPERHVCGWKDPDYANFMHRVGRTGRYGTDGLSLTLMASEDDEELMNKIQKHYDLQIDTIKEFDELVDIFRKMRDSVI